MTALLINASLAFVAGILLNFTPCVLPVIPLKVRAVLQEIQGTARSRILASGALLLGSLTFFVFLGGATAYLGWKWGALFQSKPFLSLLSLLLLMAGIAMLAHWTVRLPQIVYRMPLHRYLGAFLTGVLAGILSTPCSGPFLGSVLAYAVTQSPAIIMVLFGAVGVGLAFPYSTILLFPKALSLLPRGGRTGQQIESILALILIAGAIFFSQSILPSLLAPMLWWVFAAGVVVWTLRELQRGQRTTERLVPALLLIVLLLVGFAVFTQNGKSTLHWKPYAEASFTHDVHQGRPILLEFTADWCINCKILEKTTYASPEVIAAAHTMNLALYQVDMTDFRDDARDLLDHYHGEALPFAVLLNAIGKPVRTFSGMFNAEALVQGMLALKNKP